MKIACVAIAEMGHFFPMSHLADALIRKGHDVWFVTNEDSYNDGKSSRILTAIGCTNQVFTKDGITREMMIPERMEGSTDPKEVCMNIW